MTEPTQKMMIRNTVHFVKANLTWILVVATIVWVWTILYCFFGYVPRYGSQATALIKDSAITTRYIVPDQNYALQTTSSNASNPVLNTMGLLRSETISKALWRYLQLKHPEELKSRGIKTFWDWKRFYKDGKAYLSYKNVVGTDLISLQFIWDDPVLAQEGLETILAAFQQASLKVNRAEQESRLRYLQIQVVQVEQQLDVVRREKSAYKKKMKVVNLSRESDELAQDGIQLVTQLNQIEAKAQGKTAEYNRYQKMLGLDANRALNATGAGMNPTLAQLQSDLYQLSKTHALLKTTLTDKNPKVKEIKTQMEQVKNNIQAELKRSLIHQSNPDHVEAVSDLARGTAINQMVAAQADSIRLKTEAEVTRNRLDQINRQIEAFPDLEEVLADLDESEKSLSDALYNIRQKELESRMKNAETLSNVFVVDVAQYPLTQMFPLQGHILALGLILGLVLGAASALLRDRIQWRQWLEEFGIMESTAHAPHIIGIRQRAKDMDTRQSLDLLFTGEQDLKPVSMSSKHSETPDVQALKARLFEALSDDATNRVQHIMRTKNKYTQKAGTQPIERPVESPMLRVNKVSLLEGMGV